MARQDGMVPGSGWDGAWVRMGWGLGQDGMGPGSGWGLGHIPDSVACKYNYGLDAVPWLLQHVQYFLGILTLEVVVIRPLL